MNSIWFAKTTALISGAMIMALACAAYGEGPGDLPLLAPGKHLGVVQFQEAATPEGQARVEALWNDAVAKGMSAARFHTDWDALETGPRVYQKAGAEQQMKRFHDQGLQFMVTITTLDTGEVTVPPDLADPDDQTRFRDGMNVDAPKVVERYLALLDWVVPMMTEYGGFLLCVANEPDTMFEDHPEYVEGLANLIAASRKHVQAMNPKIAVSATLTGGAFRPGGEWADRLMKECDVAVYNYYGLDPNTFHVEDFDDNWRFLADAVRVADGRQFIIQEWGCPSGYEDKPSVINGSIEKQHEYFARTAEVMLAEPTFRAAFVFEMVDWSPQLTNLIVDLLTVGVENKADVPFVPPLEEWLRTTGLARYEDGSPKPGWYGFLDSVETLAAARREDKSAQYSLPRLTAGPHLGLCIGFEPSYPVETQQAIEEAMSRACTLGMDVGRIHTDWVTLEPAPGAFALDGLVSELNDLQARGLCPFVTITTIDSGDLSVPKDLIDSERHATFAGGMKMDDPAVVDRFKALLDQLVPMLTANGVWLLSVGNEPGGYFETHPGEEASVANFIKTMRQHVRAMDPDLPVTFTLDGVFPDLIAECDVACFNYYPIGSDLTVYEPTVERLEKELGRYFDAAGDRPIVIQELGCPAGYASKESPMKSSAEKQRRFFENVTGVLTKDPRFRAAFEFALVDWSRDTAQMWEDLILASAEEEELDAATQKDFIDKLIEWHMTCGLMRYDDGSARPAWQAFLNSLEQVYGSGSKSVAHTATAQAGESAACE